MAREEVANGQVELHQRMAATFAEGIISPLTAQTARVDLAEVVAIMAPAGAVTVPFQQHLRQGQGDRICTHLKGSPCRLMGRCGRQATMYIGDIVSSTFVIIFSIIVLPVYLGFLCQCIRQCSLAVIHHVT